MSADLEEQEDELLALQSILGPEEFVRDEPKAAGEIRVSVELCAHFNVALKEDESLLQYEISSLPPLLLTFELPEDYPSSSPPSFTLTCSWLTHTQLSALCAQLTALYQDTGGAVVLFTWVQFLKEDALRFLDIHTLLELPSDEHSTQNYSQDSLQALSEPKKSGDTDNQSCNVSDPCEVEHPMQIPADGRNPSTSGHSLTDSIVASDSSSAHQNNSPSRHSKVSQNGAHSGPKADYQETSHDSDQTAQASDAKEAEFKTNSQNDQSSTEGKSKPPPAVQFDQSGPEGFLNGENVLTSLSLPSSSSGPPDDSVQGAASLPVHPRVKEKQTLSLTPSQALLSQLLIYDAAQKQKQFASTVFDCGVCFMSWLGSDCVRLHECGHIFCRKCLAQFCKLQITEGNVRAVTCPQADCTATPTPAQVKSLVGDELFSRYDRLLLQNTLDCMPDVVYCPRQSCGSAVIQDKSSTAAMCAACGFAFCVACRKTYHGADDCQRKKVRPAQKATEHTEQAGVDLPQSQEGMKALWDDYADGSKERRHLLESRYSRKMLQLTMTEYLSEDWVLLNSKYCPHCFWRIEKNEGCNVMLCSQCRKMFCWACLAKLSPPHGSEHFEDGGCSLYQQQEP
uniref:E3 ubiquitin-protein ligase RNF14-like n=1 Tax=Scatophagus argus TaxID=75038 RepID=UPI001ED7D593|nr:E3 ubiquitin-protein ligase RNF14-like [Scatophagus argus]